MHLSGRVEFLCVSFGITTYAMAVFLCVVYIGAVMYQNGTKFVKSVDFVECLDKTSHTLIWQENLWSVTELT